MSQSAEFCFTLFLSLTAVNSDEAVYKAVSEKVVLSLDSVPDTFSHITWKHGLDLAVQWYSGETFAYRDFKGRVMLNSSTGALTITGLTRHDSGSYTAEINNNQVSKPTRLLVISPVSKPSVSTWCHPDMTYCVFTCEGNTTDAEPITYQFGASDKVWNSTNVHKITKDEKEPRFRCMLDNPVSFRSSEEVLNPFITNNRAYLLTCLIPLAGVILSVCFLFFLHKRRKGQDAEGTAQERSGMLQHDQETPMQDPTSVVSPDTNNLTALIPEIKETQTRDSTSPVPPETRDETAISSVISEVQEISAQDSLVSPETSDQTEAPETDPTPVASLDTCDETERSSVISETSDQDQTSPASPHTSKETENSAVMSSGQETAGQEPPAEEDDDPRDDGQS